MPNNVSHYRILRRLGEGGVGEVYLAEDTRLERKVSLTLLPASYEYDALRRECFLQEARAASAIRSPNVASIFDIGESDGLMFIAMEYVEGELLSARIESAPLDLHLAVDIATQVAEALEEAHSLGIVHRDLKSSNLILNNQGLVRVLDFGVAKIAAAPARDDDRTARLGMETSPGVLPGAAAYMSPEQRGGFEIDGRSDLFSLGVVLFEMLTGKLPPEGMTSGDLLAATAGPDPDAIKNEIRWVLDKALRRDKSQRYQTARDLIIDLKNLTRQMNDRKREPSGSIARIPGLTPGLMERTPKRDSLTRDSGARRRSRKSVDSIAVLPFVNSDDDPDVDYLSDGITESLINSLSRIPRLRVMARSTVFRYKGRAIDPRQAGLELNVRAVMTGRMRKVKGRFVIGAELVDVADGSQLWGEQYTRDSFDIVSLQDEISCDIAEKLRLKLNGGEKRGSSKPESGSPDTGSPDFGSMIAQDLYLKGRYNWSKWSEQGFREAIACYEQAIEADSHFAAAYAGLGVAYSVQSYFYSDPVSTRAAVLKAKACAKRALEIDPAFPEAHLLAANVARVHDWDWARAEQEFKLTLELNPNLAEAHLCYALFLMDQCQFESAHAEMKTALKLDPLSLPVNTAAGMLFFSARRYSDAINQLRKSLQLNSVVPISELDPTYNLCHELLGASLEQEQKSEEAAAAYLKIISGVTNGDEMTFGLRDAFVESGISGFWRAFAEIADELTERRVVTPIFVATIFARLGETDLAFKRLERALSERTPGLTHIKADPRFEKLHSDRRFSVLMSGLGLTSPMPMSMARRDDSFMASVELNANKKMHAYCFDC